MPWIEAVLRGQRVFAKAKDDGSFDASGGLVEIRYKANDGRAYRANSANLQVADAARLLPDDACGSAEAVARNEQDRTAKPAAAKSKSGSGSGKSSGKSKGAVGAPGPAFSGPHWIAYTDGACSGNPGPTGVGVIVIDPSGVIREASEYLGEATNNVGELTGVLRALEAIPADAEHVAIHTDSKYAIGVISQGWKAKANTELIEKTKRVLRTRKDVRLVYVPGHSGVPLNERADELAREAIRTRSTRKIPPI